MTKFINAFGDRMLAKVLKKESAGACIDGVGTFCGWVAVNGGKCGSDGHFYQEVCYGVQTCYGSCGAACNRGVAYQHTQIVC
ncbi:hypothetical protein ABH926_010182 [Catenulispora sp. GP43]|uniref:hypothetical protein n=1 Tax=Catenulispora sp. GP43 TaxID=3156263 RepID=UPI00351171F2